MTLARIVALVAAYAIANGLLAAAGIAALERQLDRPATVVPREATYAPAVVGPSRLRTRTRGVLDGHTPALGTWRPGAGARPFHVKRPVKVLHLT